MGRKEPGSGLLRTRERGIAMLDKKVAELINVQVNKEFYSAYLYLDFANYYREAELNGFANWYQVQAQEERDHAMLFMQYLQNNSGKVTLEAIDKPDKQFEDFGGPLKAGLEHEIYVTALYTRAAISESSIYSPFGSCPKSSNRFTRLSAFFFSSPCSFTNQSRNCMVRKSFTEYAAS